MITVKVEDKALMDLRDALNVLNDSEILEIKNKIQRASGLIGKLGIPNFTIDSQSKDDKLMSMSYTHHVMTPNTARVGLINQLKKEC